MKLNEENEKRLKEIKNHLSVMDYYLDNNKYEINIYKTNNFGFINIFSILTILIILIVILLIVL